VRTARFPTVMAVLAAAAAAASGPLLALRVDLEPVRPAGADTVMAIAVQVAPEDRGRLGREAWLRIDLTTDGAVVDRVARPVEVEDGRASVEAAWPPGTYDLRVDLESADGAHTGFWVTEVEVPRLAPQEPAPVSEAPPGTPPATPAPVAEPREEPASVTATASAGGDGPPSAAPGPQPEPAPRSAGPPVVDDVGPEAEGVPPSAVDAPDPDEPRSAAVATVPAPPTGETTGPTAIEDPVQASAADPATPPPSPPATTWRPASSGEAEVTVVAVRDDRPVLSLGASDLRLEAAGAPATIVAVDGGPEVPIQLGLVVALSDADDGRLVRIGRALSRPAARGGDIVGRLVVAAGGPGGVSELRWDDAAVRLPEILAEGAGKPGPDLVEATVGAIDAVGERPGRRFVVVVTDGLGDGSRSDWRRLQERAASSSAPILAVGLWTPEFDHRTRRRLSEIAAASGGEAYFAQGIDRLQTALERYGDLVAASFLVRIERPAPDGDGPVPVSLEAVAPGVELVAPPRAR